MRVIVDAGGKSAKQVEFATGWIGPNNEYRGRPNDVLVAKDGPSSVTNQTTRIATA